MQPPFHLTWLDVVLALFFLAGGAMLTGMTLMHLSQLTLASLSPMRLIALWFGLYLGVVLLKQAKMMLHDVVTWWAWRQHHMPAETSHDMSHK